MFGVKINKLREKRDTEKYSKYTSDKALLARYTALRCGEFVPYFDCGYSEESKVIGTLFGLEVVKPK